MKENQRKREILKNKFRAEETRVRRVNDYSAEFEALFESKHLKDIVGLAESMPRHPTPVTEEDEKEYAQDPSAVDARFVSQRF